MEICLHLHKNSKKVTNVVKKKISVFVVFKCEQNLLTNSIWTYTIRALRVRSVQWEIFAKEFSSEVDSG